MSLKTLNQRTFAGRTFEPVTFGGEFTGAEASPVEQYGSHLCGNITSYAALGGEVESYSALTGDVSANPC